MKNFSDKILEEIKIHFIFNKDFIPSEKFAFHQMMWKNMVEMERPQMTTQRMRFAC
jgi:hypothetical protein